MENEIEQLETMYFVHHFLTHSTVMEVNETSYKSMDDLSPFQREQMFESSDGKVYMLHFPMMMTRDGVADYVAVTDDEFHRYTVIEINNEQPDTPVTFACVSYYRGTRNVEEYGTLDALTQHLIQDAEPEYRNPVLAWAKTAQPGSDHTQMNGVVKEIWSAK